jgi:hypothetical protein
MSIGIASAQVKKDKSSAGAGDDLGNHTATQDLDMAGNSITNIGGTTDASTGALRFANNVGAAWRNNADSADKLLKVDTSDRLEYDGVDIPTISSTDVLTNKTMDANSNTFSNIGASEVDRDEVKTSFRNKRWWIFIAAGTGFTGNGAYGTITQEGTRTNNGDADGNYTNSATATSTNSDAGVFHTAVIRRSFNFDIEWKFRVNTTTSRRVWIGCFNSDPMASDAPTGAHIGVRVSTSAGSTQFVLSHADGTTQAETNLLASDTSVHTIRIVADEANTKFQYSWDGAALVDVTTNIPASTTDLGCYQEIRTLTAGAANFDVWYEDSFADK